MANVKITELTAYTDAISTDIIPIVDITNDVTKKITISDLVKTIPSGTAALPGLAFDGNANTGIYRPTTNTFSIATAGVEAFRYTSDQVPVRRQPAPAAIDVTATATIANLKTGIVTSSTAAAVTITLPTGTNSDGGFASPFVNMAFEWSVINTGVTNSITLQANTGHTIVGSAIVLADSAGRFMTRRTAAATWVTYRIST